MANVSTLSTPLGSRARDTQAARRPGVFRRILEAIMESRQRTADREIAEIIGRRGGVLSRELLGHNAPVRSRS
jgi:hypothetical protein